MKNLALLFVFAFCLLELRGQDKSTSYASHFKLSNNISSYSLMDSLDRTKFIFDSSSVFITAIDRSGKKLWRTDPHKDNNIPDYRFTKPRIVGYYLENNNRTGNKEVIWIIYSNTQFGIIDKRTGKFTFLGQD